MTVIETNNVTLGSLFRPMRGVVATGTVVTDVINTTTPAGQTFVHSAYSAPTFYGWNSGVISAPPCNWVVPTTMGGLATPNGAMNHAGPRNHYLSSGFYGVNHDFEFGITGDKFSIQSQFTSFDGHACFDSQIYIDGGDGQGFQKLHALPLGFSTSSGVNYRHVELGNYQSWRIRVTQTSNSLVQGVWVDSATDIWAPVVDRPYIIVDGDSYVEGGGGSYDAGIWNSGATNGANSFGSHGVADVIAEMTGFWPIRLGQGGTGYFNANNGSYSDPTLTYSSFSTFLSTSRVSDAATKHLAKRPVAWVVNGTQNDGTLSGNGTLANCRAGMAARAAAGYARVRAVDPTIPIIQVSPEPYNNFAGETLPGTNHYFNRLGHMDAVAATPNAYFVDAIYWTGGTGTTGASSLNGSIQSRLMYSNAPHMDQLGWEMYGQRITNNLAGLPVSAARAAQLA
jgi:hypothetical protein